MKPIKELLLGAMLVTFVACQTAGPGGQKSIAVQWKNQTTLSQNLEVPQENDPELTVALVERNWDDLVQVAQQRLQSNPSEHRFLSYLALSYYNLGYYTKARYYALLANEREPRSLNYNLLGLITSRRARIPQDYQNALNYFAAGWRQNPHDQAIGLNLAYLNLELGNIEIAKKLFAAVREVCQDCTAARLGHGISELRLGEVSSAKRRFLRLQKVSSAAPLANYYLALIAFNHKNDYRRCQQELDKILSREDTVDEDLLHRARTLWTAAGEAMRQL